MNYTEEQINEFKEKAAKWDALGAKIERCYVDEEGNEVPESDDIDLGTIGELAAAAFGWL